MSTIEPHTVAEKFSRYYHELFENSTDVIYLIEVTKEQRFIHLDINDAYVKATGIPKEEIVGRYVDELKNQELREILLRKYGSCVDAGEQTTIIADYPLPSGIHTYHSALTPIRDENGRIHRLVGIARDITERKQDEDHLQRTKAKLAAVISTIPDLIWVKDGSGSYLMCNPAFERFFGAECGEIIGKTDYDFISAEQADFFRQKDREAMKAGEMRINEEEIIFAADGRQALLETRKIPVYNGDEFMGVLGIGRDITESRRAEREIIESSQFIQSILEALPDLLFEIDREGTYLNVWTNDVELLAAQKELLLGRKISEILDKTNTEICMDAIQIADEEGKCIGHQICIDLPSGCKWFELSVSKISPHGDRFLTLSRDITERKQYEIELALSNEKFRTITENTRDTIARYDRQCRRTYANSAFVALSGKSQNELLGIKPTYYYDSPQSHMYEEALQRVLDSGVDEVFEFSWPDKSGNMITSHIHIVPEKDEAGNVYSVLATGRDITKQKETDWMLRTLTSALNVSSESVFLVDLNTGCFVYVNDTASNQLGYTKEELTSGMGVLDIDPDFTPKLWDQHINDLQTLGNVTLETTHRTKTGSLYPAEVVAHYFEHEGREYNLAVTRDITERKRNEEQLRYKEERLREAQQIAKIGSWEVEFPGLKLTWSDEIFRIFEIDPQSSHPSYDHFLNAIHPDDRIYVDQSYSEALEKRIPYDAIHRLLMSDGRVKYVHERAITIYDEEDMPIRTVGTVQDITEQKKAEKKIQHMALHDALTGLPNRVLAKERMENAIRYAKENSTKTALLFIDLDGFKTINDTLGHSVGDNILKQVANRLKECIRSADTLCRLGGDEFLLILSGIESNQDIVIIVEKILEEFTAPINVHHHNLPVSMSIGIALYPDHGEHFESLLQKSDTAMYKAKDAGKNTYCFYSEEMKHVLIGEFKIQNDLRQALRENQFLLHYQPQIDLATKRIIGVEALIRWRHPQLGMIPPMQFISIAENNGLIVPIGEWVIHEACRQLSRWKEQGIRTSIAINISAIQFKRGNLVEIVEKALQETGVKPSCLEFELTESIMMHDTEKTLEVVQQLKNLGLQLSIDDFGTGYSSLAYLKRFTVDKLKIDQSFVRDILSDQEDAVIVRTIIQMAKSLNLKTIAEGVENQDVLDIVESFGCDEVQGYHYSKPIEASDFEAFYHAF